MRDDRKRPRGERVSEALATRVRGFAFDALPPGRRATSNLYMDPDKLREGTRIGPASERYVVDRECVLCFADHDPFAGFAHECSYYLHDARTGELYRRIAAEFPPYPMEGIHLLNLFHEPVPAAKSFPLPPQREGGMETRMQRVLAAGAPGGKRYAILFAGECDPFHVNDIELSFRTLIHTFGFDPANVFVLLHDGTKTGAPFLDSDGHARTWPGDNTAFQLELDGDGTRQSFQAKLREFSLTPNDLLFIHTGGHGGTSYAGGGQYLRVGPDQSDRYYSFEMQADLQALGNCQSLLVLMNQCFAGGFGDAILAVGGTKAQNTFFAAACGADARAHATADRNWSQFGLNWFEAEMQQHIDPVPYMPGTDDDGDGKVEASEAYDYCVFLNNVSKGYDSPVEGRMPPPDTNGDSPADQIALV